MPGELTMRCDGGVRVARRGWPGTPAGPPSGRSMLGSATVFGTKRVLIDQSASTSIAALNPVRGADAMRERQPLASIAAI